MNDIYQKIASLEKQGVNLILVTVVSKEGSAPSNPGDKILILKNGKTYGSVGGGEIENIIIKEGKELLCKTTNKLKTYDLDNKHFISDEKNTGMICGGKITVFYEVITSGENLYIFGAGHVVQSLIYHLRNLSWKVSIIDPRNTDESCDFATVYKLDYSQSFNKMLFFKKAYFIIATPSHQFDYDVLYNIYKMNIDPTYIGLLSSRNKAAMLIEKLKTDLGKDIDLSLLHAPVGLDIGGSSIEEISISILSELQAIKHGKSSIIHLKEKTFS